MPFLNLLKNNWKIITVALVIITTYGYGYKTGMDSVQKEWDKTIFAAQERAIDMQKQQTKISGEVSRDYQNKISDLRKRYNDLMRLYSSSNGLPAIPGAAAGHNATSGANGLSRAIPQDAGYLMFQADEQTQRLIGCQNWVRSMKKNP